MDEAEWQSHPAPLPAAVLSGSQQDRAEVAGPARGCHAEPPLHDDRATRGQRSTVAKRSQPRIPATAAPLGRLTMVPPTLFAQGHLGVLGVTGFLMQDLQANPLDYVEGGKWNGRRLEISQW